MDFAVSSGLQSGALTKVIDSPETIFGDYESQKRCHLETEKICTAAGFRFTPLILESHGGGMSQLTRGFVNWLGKAVAASRGTETSAESLRIAQRISSTLQRESARAILRRLVPAEEEPLPTAWAEWAP